MNLKRTLFTAVSAVALSLSLVAPVALAETSSVTVNEAGSFSNLHMWYGGVAFSPVSVTSSQLAKVTKNDQYIDLTDSRASSPGWTIQLAAGPLQVTGTSYEIASSNLSLTFSHWGPRCADPAIWNSENPGNPSNPFQTVDNQVVGKQSLGSPIDVLSASAGRGCNRLAGLYDFELVVPSGTYTGGGSAVYTGQMTLTATQGEFDD